MSREFKKLEGLEKHYQLRFRDYYDFCIAFDKLEAIRKLSENAPEEIKRIVGNYIKRFEMNNPKSWL